MKRGVARLFFCFAFFPFLAGAQMPWADVYKAGPIKLSPDASFGKDVDWGSFLYESFKDIAVAGDGTIFMANNREHTIHKFDPSGRKLMTFGRHGQGPGDFEGPGSPSILDGKYLIIGEYPLVHRISVFDLNGRFYKLLKTQRPVYDVAALSGTKIAYLAQQFEQPGSDRLKPGVQSIPMTIRVVLMDIATGTEKVILMHLVAQKMVMMESGGGISFGDDLIGGVYLAGTFDGNLAVGISSSPRIDIYNPQGQVVRSVTLNQKPRPVTADYVARYKKAQLAAMGKNAEIPAGRRKRIEEIERLDFSPLFEATLPLYSEMMTDSEGNFLLFKRADDPGTRCLDFTAYSPRGEWIADTRLDPGDFDIEIDYRFRRLRFSNAGLIGLAPLKSDADEIPVLFRVVPNSGK